LPAPRVARRSYAGSVIRSRRLGLSRIVEQGSPKQDGALPVVPAAPHRVRYQCLRYQAGVALHVPFGVKYRVLGTAIQCPEPIKGVFDRAPIDALGLARGYKIIEHWHHRLTFPVTGSAELDGTASGLRNR